MSSTAEHNVATVREFYENAINRKDFAATRPLVGPTYIQHNPRIADGVEGLQAFIGDLRTRFPDLHAEVKQLYADGDVVIGHVHGVRVPGEPGTAIVDIFRFEDGRIVEHWDVMQPVPTESANANGLF